MLKIIATIFLITSCTSQTLILKKGSGSQSDNEETATVVETQQDGGTTKAGLNANSGKTQAVTVPEGSAIAGSQVLFPPGSIAIDTSISIEQGAPVASDSVLADLAITGGLSASGESVVITSDVPFDAAKPFTVLLPLPLNGGAALTQDSLSNLIVIYKIFIAATGEYLNGILLRSDIRIKDGLAEIETSNFGSFQTIITTETITVKKEVKSATPIVTQASYVSPVFSSVSMAAILSDGFLNAAERLSGVDLVQNVTATGHTAVAYSIATESSACDAARDYQERIKSNATLLSADGRYKVCVRLTDSAGNWGYHSGSFFTLDVTAPTFQSLPLINGAADGYLGLAELGSTTDIAGTLQAKGHSQAAYKLLNAAANCTTAQNYGPLPKNTSTDFSSDGSYKICVRLTDAAGNITYSESSSFVYKKTPPVFQSLVLGNQAADGFINAAERTFSTEMTTGILATGYDAISYKLVPAATVCDNLLTYSTAVPRANSSDFGADGSYKICVRLSDLAGNVAFGSGPTITLDIAPPVFSGLAEVMRRSDADKVWLFWLPATDTSSGGSDISYDICYSITIGQCASSFTAIMTTAPGVFDHEVTGLTAGTDYEFLVRARDQAGNRDTNTIVNDNRRLTNILSVAVAFSHGCALISGGSVRCWGNNQNGQLGNGSIVNSPFPVLALASDAIAIDVGDSHSCAVLTDNTVKCWGANFYGQIGDNSTTQRTTPVLVSALSNAVSLALGGGHSCALLGDSTVACWGRNTTGQLGDGTTTQRNAPVAVPALSPVASLTAGDFHNCAMLVGGTVSCWGYNDAGQLGDGTLTDQWSPVAVSGISSAISIGAGISHSCARLSTNNIKCWGNNLSGQLGDGTTTNSPVPVDVAGITATVALELGGSQSCILLSDNTIKCWGAGNLGSATVTQTVAAIPVTGIANASSITIGSGFSCTRLLDATVKCWGQNHLSQLGDGISSRRKSPVAVEGIMTASAISAGSTNGCAKIAGNTLKCWGAGSIGQNGDGTTLRRFAPVSVTGITNAGMVASGSNHSCALLVDGSIKCWGANASGQLGDGTATQSSVPVAVTGILNATSVASGDFHSCAVLSDNTARCWGKNNNGQLGDGTTSDSLTPVTVSGLSSVRAIDLGTNHSCALLLNNTVKCWGFNSSGQLGDGTSTQSTTPVNVTGITNAAAIDIGSSFSCALLSDKTIKCWGVNTSGQIGDGTTSTALTPVSVSGISTATAITAGNGHACAVLTDKSMKCWGQNTHGQLGDGTQTGRLTPVTMLGISNATAVAANIHTCVLLGNGSIRCLGTGANGNLGSRALETALPRGLARP